MVAASEYIRRGAMMPGDEGSITRWIGGLKAGDEAAAQQLWERYFARMVGLARDKLRAGRRGDMGSDEEDAALSAFDSFCAGATRGQFPALGDRDDLWRLLALITAPRSSPRPGAAIGSSGAAGSSATPPTCRAATTPTRTTSWPAPWARSQPPRRPPSWPRSTAGCSTPWPTRP